MGWWVLEKEECLPWHTMGFWQPWWMRKILIVL